MAGESFLTQRILTSHDAWCGHRETRSKQCFCSLSKAFCQMSTRLAGSSAAHRTSDLLERIIDFTHLSCHDIKTSVSLADFISEAL